MVDSTTQDPSPRPRRARGVAPSLLSSQVTSTAAWALAGDHPAVHLVARAEAIEASWRQDEASGEYFALLLAAHYLTVATFVPTDVDSRIRHHAWVEADAARVASQLDTVDAAQAWDARRVSARTVADPRDPDGKAISGHDGEWLSVYAGALGRAIALEDDTLIDRSVAAIEGSLDRQASAYRAVEASGDTIDLLRAATVLAHNAGDLSRVVEEWPRRPLAESHRARFAKLGHERPERFGGAFLRAGALNKALTAVENHRFLALRASRGLRTARELLLPIGPFFDDWGRLVARSPLLTPEDHADVVAALLETHLAGPEQSGCLRALAGIHDHAPGGLDRLAPDLPARLRKLVSGGAVREALKTPREAFERRIVGKAKAFRGAGR